MKGFAPIFYRLDYGRDVVSWATRARGGQATPEAGKRKGRFIKGGTALNKCTRSRGRTINVGSKNGIGDPGQRANDKRCSCKLPSKDEGKGGR